MPAAARCAGGALEGGASVAPCTRRTSAAAAIGDEYDFTRPPGRVTFQV